MNRAITLACVLFELLLEHLELPATVEASRAAALARWGWRRRDSNIAWLETWLGYSVTPIGEVA